MAYDGKSKRLLAFGGKPPTSDLWLGDTWAWDGTWHRLVVTPSPSARLSPAMAWDPVRGVVLLFGGRLSPGSPLLTDTWTWDGSRWAQLHPTHGPRDVETPFLAFDDSTQQMVLTGVYTSGLVPNQQQTWTWNGADWILAASAATPQVGQLQLAYDPASHRLLAVPQGGSAMWSWDGARWNPLPQVPPDGIWLIGTDFARGSIIGVTAFEGTFVWNGAGWERAHPDDDPRASANAVLTWNPDRNALQEYDVCGGTFCTNYVFSWTGTAWQ